MKWKRLSLTLATADPDGVCQTQNPGNNADLTINGALASGGVATFDVARRVAIVSAADDSAVTFTVYGTDRNGIVISESLLGGNIATVYTEYDFKTVTRIATSGNAGSLTVGTNGVASTAWVPHDSYPSPFNVGGRVLFSAGASLTAKIEITNDDVQNLTNVQTGRNIDADDSAYTGLTTDTLFNIIAPIVASRLTITAFTSGTVEYQVSQQGA